MVNVGTVSIGIRFESLLQNNSQVFPELQRMGGW